RAGPGGALRGATSEQFYIEPGPATRLVFTVQPGNATAGQTIAPAVELSALDAPGNVVPSFTGDVTVALGATNPSGGTLAGTTTVTAADGVATFYSLSVDKSGTGYTLSATARSRSATRSAPTHFQTGATTAAVFALPPRTT